MLVTKQCSCLSWIGAIFILLFVCPSPAMAFTLPEQPAFVKADTLTAWKAVSVGSCTPLRTKAIPIKEPSKEAPPSTFKILSPFFLILIIMLIWGLAASFMVYWPIKNKKKERN